MSTRRTKIALVTGAERELGRLVACRLAAAGQLVYAALPDPLGAQRGQVSELCAIARRQRSRLRSIELEPRDAASIEHAVSWIHLEAGRIDVLVHSLRLPVATGDDELAPNWLLRVERTLARTTRVTRTLLDPARASSCALVIYVSDPEGHGPEHPRAWRAVQDLTRELAEADVHTVLLRPQRGATGQVQADSTAAAIAALVEACSGPSSSREAHRWRHRAHEQGVSRTPFPTP